MKKRLRKKLRLGEFREDCFELDFSFDPPLSVEEDYAFWDAFIVGFIEAKDLQYGGVSSFEGWKGVVEGLPRETLTEADRQTVIDWLEKHPRVSHISAGPLRDAWHEWD